MLGPGLVSVVHDNGGFLEHPANMVASLFVSRALQTEAWHWAGKDNLHT